MASTQQLKSRISSVKNTKQITKAMELVAASKMRRAQENAARSREFRNLARSILTRIRELTDVSTHPLFTKRPVKTKLYIVITGDRGLAGAYNSNVLKQFTRELLSDRENGVKSQAILIGKQAVRFVGKVEGCEVLAAYTNFTESPTANDINHILTMIMDMYTKPEVDAIDIIYTEFKSSVLQEVKTDRILPAAFKDTDISGDLHEAIFEPSVNEVLDKVTPRLLEVQLLQAFLDAQASEQSMRMMAMKNATDNASDLVDDLTLAFNTARQSSITQEIAEITGGAEAIK